MFLNISQLWVKQSMCVEFVRAIAQGYAFKGGGYAYIMRNCKKNNRNMWYSLYNGKTPIIDEFGNETLEYEITYSKPVKFKGSVSIGQGSAEDMPFGTNVSYDRVITTFDMALPIDENSIIWINNEPKFNSDGTVIAASADYKVSAMPLDGLVSLRIAIKHINANNTETVSPEVANPVNSDVGNSEDMF